MLLLVLSVENTTSKYLNLDNLLSQFVEKPACSYFFHLFLLSYNIYTFLWGTVYYFSKITSF